jgi:hypothetical protein
MIGTSFSFCVRDILNGNVDVEDVKRIYTNTKCPSPSDWEYVLEKYMEWYWGSKPEALAIAGRLLNSGKVYQPRLESPSRYVYSSNLWVESEADILFHEE